MNTFHRIPVEKKFVKNVLLLHIRFQMFDFFLSLFAVWVSFLCAQKHFWWCALTVFVFFARLLSYRRRPRPGWRWCQRLRIRLGFKEILSFRNSIKSLFRFAQSNEIRYFKPFMDVLHVELSSGPTHQSYRFPKRRRNFLSVKYLSLNIEILSAAAVKL